MLIWQFYGNCNSPPNSIHQASYFRSEQKLCSSMCKHYKCLKLNLCVFTLYCSIQHKFNLNNFYFLSAVSVVQLKTIIFISISVGLTFLSLLLIFDPKVKTIIFKLFYFQNLYFHFNFIIWSVLWCTRI